MTKGKLIKQQSNIEFLTKLYESHKMIVALFWLLHFEESRNGIAGSYPEITGGIEMTTPGQQNKKAMTCPQLLQLIQMLMAQKPTLEDAQDIIGSGIMRILPHVDWPNFDRIQFCLANHVLPFSILNFLSPGHEIESNGRCYIFLGAWWQMPISLILDFLKNSAYEPADISELEPFSRWSWCPESTHRTYVVSTCSPFTTATIGLDGLLDTNHKVNPRHVIGTEKEAGFLVRRK